MMGVIATAICLTYIDKVGRRFPLILSASAQTVVMALLMVFFKFYAQSNNKVGQGFTVAWIFCMSIAFSLGFVPSYTAIVSCPDLVDRYNALQLLYIAEIFPTALRSRGTASKSDPRPSLGEYLRMLAYGSNSLRLC